MALFRCSGGSGGGGSSFDFGEAPDAKYVATLGNGSTASIPVTQKPRYILFGMFPTTGAQGAGLIGCYDVENNKAYKYGYWSSADQSGNWDNVSNYITGVTSSAVAIKNSYGVSCRILCGCYY